MRMEAIVILCSLNRVLIFSANETSLLNTLAIVSLKLVIWSFSLEYIYIFDKNFNNHYFITLEISLIHTVDIEDNKYYLNNIMEKVIPKSKQNFYKTFSRRFDLKKPSSVVL